MPMHYRIDPERKLVVTTAVGEVVDADVLRHAQALLEDPAVQGLNEIVDLGGWEAMSVSIGAVQAAAQLLRERGLNASGAKLAIVADADVVFGMARVYQAHREHPAIEISVFRERRKAFHWLGVEDD